MSEQKELHRGDRIADVFPCIADEVEGKNPCGSSDGMSIYHHGATEDAEEWYDASCWVCKQGFSAHALAHSSVGETFLSGDERERVLRKSRPKKRITPRENNLIRDRTLSMDDMRNASSPLYRGLKGEYLAFFAHRLEYKDGDLFKVYYPETQKAKFMGYKPRHTQNKDFVCPIGWTGVDSDLSGQSLFKGGGKYIAIVGGENDKVALFQGLRDYQILKGQEGYDPIAVVSTTTGEGSAARQCADNYEFLDSFDNIYVGLDNDEAGEAATEELLKVLPAEKVSLITWSMEDPHAMLEAGKEQQMISNFYGAKPLVRQQVKTSKDADDEMEEELLRDGVPLPPFMHKLSDMMAGDIPLGYIVNFIAQTGGGKTTFINEMVYHWIFNCPYRVGILSLELNAGQYQTAMLSRHTGVKIQRIKSKEAKREFLNRPETILSRKELREDEYGRERYVLLDERDGGLSQVRNEIEKLIRKYDCKVIIIDPIQDLFEGVRIEDQSAFIKYLKGIAKGGIAIVNVCHITKAPSRTDAKGNRIRRKLTEDDVAGVSNLVKSGAANIFFDRDKYADTELGKNTTEVYMPKCRWTGDAGEAGEWFYDNKTHTVYELEDWLKLNPEDEGEIIADTPEPTTEEEDMFND
jgi:hypothetical protein